mmetsp:Transcript_19695/g.35631  ORF Transcript_19695/g.35631 Transcript_19695/m.35631 type:complete len:340 (-) Transcript_19695:1689-2708(-)
MTFTHFFFLRVVLSAFNVLLFLCIILLFIMTFIHFFILCILTAYDILLIFCIIILFFIVATCMHYFFLCILLFADRIFLIIINRRRRRGISIVFVLFCTYIITCNNCIFFFSVNVHHVLIIINRRFGTIFCSVVAPIIGIVNFRSLFLLTIFLHFHVFLLGLTFSLQVVIITMFLLLLTFTLHRIRTATATAINGSIIIIIITATLLRILLLTGRPPQNIKLMLRKRHGNIRIVSNVPIPQHNHPNHLALHPRIFLRLQHFDTGSNVLLILFRKIVRVLVGIGRVLEHINIGKVEGGGDGIELEAADGLFFLDDASEVFEAAFFDADDCSDEVAGVGFF